METVSNYVNIVHYSKKSNALQFFGKTLILCVGGRGAVLPTLSPQFSLSVHEVKTDRITLADFPIGTGKTTRLICGSTSSNSYLILFDGFYATSVLLRVYLLLVPLFARVVLQVEGGDSIHCARLGSCETTAGYERLLCLVSLCCSEMVRIPQASFLFGTEQRVLFYVLYPFGIYYTILSHTSSISCQQLLHSKWYMRFSLLHQVKALTAHKTRMQYTGCFRRNSKYFRRW
jgi:hypothetical protein